MRQDESETICLNLNGVLIAATRLRRLETEMSFELQKRLARKLWEMRGGDLIYGPLEREYLGELLWFELENFPNAEMVNLHGK